MDSLKWLWGYIKKYKASIMVFLLLSPIYIVGAFVYPVVIGFFVDDVIYGGVESLLIQYVVIIFAIICIRELVQYMRQLVLEHISQNTIKAIRNKLYNKLQGLDCYFYDRSKTGDLMNRLTMDTDAIRILLSNTSVAIVNLCFFIVIGFIVLVSINWVITLALFSITPIIGYFAYKLSKTNKSAFIRIRESAAELSSVVRENIDANRVVKAYAREDYEIEKFEKKNQQYNDAFMNHIDLWTKYYPPLYFCVKVTSIIFILVGGIFVIRGDLSVGEFTTINGSLWCITTPMSTVGDVLIQFQQFVASSMKIIALEKEEPVIKNREVKKRDTGVSGKIQFKNVTFAFEGTRVAKNMNFTVEAGQTLAIIGPTGSGKSTIINLLSRFYDPTYGTIYIDDINIKNYDLATIRKNVASAMQSVFLFSDTIANNILYGEPNATIDDVIRVAKMADAHSFIEKLPDGYDTIIGELGMGLSGGQRQRISLARALLKNPAILVLDDTTSALDMETEYSIQENLKQTNRTKVIIANRISSVKNADLILVLNQGNIVEWGTHEILMNLGGYYKSVFDHQFGDFGDASNYHINHPVSMNLSGRRGVING